LKAEILIGKTPMSEATWTLHARLAADTTAVGELALSRVLAVNAAEYPWLILVPRRAGASEIADLGADAFPLMAEIALVSLMLKEVTQCDKINVAALGNMVPQLHVHIVARCKTDPLWPKSVFGAEAPRAADAQAFARFVVAMREKLGAMEVR
jgi:diadenosine tetraphosphate (Ap4A) HIT family hydrolase